MLGIKETTVIALLGGIGGALSRIPVVPNLPIPEWWLVANNFLLGAFLAVVFAFLAHGHYNLYSLYGLAGLVGFFSQLIVTTLKKTDLIRTVLRTVLKIDDKAD